MGIAVDDYDGDGLLDCSSATFTTSTTCCIVRSPGDLHGRQRRARLKEPTVPCWGSERNSSTAISTGWPDLVLANGNVEDFRSLGIPFRMRGQYFANLGNGRFSELPAGQVGDYFGAEQLGRGMARLDWNRDGREDFAVSNLDTPASLVTNRRPASRALSALQLRGVQSSRDAIGTTVVARVGGRSLVKQLTAGDGYSPATSGSSCSAWERTGPSTHSRSAGLRDEEQRFWASCIRVMSSICSWRSGPN